MCPGISGHSEDMCAPGEAGPHSGSRHRADGGAPKAESRWGCPAGPPALLDGGADGERTGRCSAEALGCADITQGPVLREWTSSGRGQKPGSIDWASPNPSRTGGRGMRDAGQACRPLGPPSASASKRYTRPSRLHPLCRSDWPKAKFDLCCGCGVERCTGPESYSLGFKLGSNMGKLSQLWELEWKVAKMGR